MSVMTQALGIVGVFYFGTNQLVLMSVVISNILKREAKIGKIPSCCSILAIKEEENGNTHPETFFS